MLSITAIPHISPARSIAVKWPLSSKKALIQGVEPPLEDDWTQRVVSSDLAASTGAWPHLFAYRAAHGITDPISLPASVPWLLHYV
jgi:hypothetical protein